MDYRLSRVAAVSLSSLTLTGAAIAVDREAGAIHGLGGAAVVAVHDAGPSGTATQMQARAEGGYLDVPPVVPITAGGVESFSFIK